MNDKIHIVQPTAKRVLKSPKNHQISNEESVLNENSDVLLKDNTDIPQISREDFHVAGWHGRSRIPLSARKVSPKKNDPKKDSLSDADLSSEPGYGRRPQFSNNSFKRSRKENSKDDDFSENDELLRVTRVTKAESARELRPKYYSTLKSPQKNSFEDYENANLVASQFVAPKEPAGQSKSPRKPNNNINNREKKISVRSEVEQKIDSEINSSNKNKPFCELFRRKEILIGISKVYFPNSQTDEEAILNLINHNKDCIELNEVKGLLKDIENRNRELLLAPFHNSRIRFNGKQQREAESLVNEISKSRKQIGKLKLFTMNPSNSALLNTNDFKSTVYNPQEDMGYEKIDQQVTFTKEKNFIRALEYEVSRLESELASVEKRIKLMTQRKSAYAGLHAERISDQYGKQLIDIPMLGEDTEEDMVDPGIFKMTVSRYNEDEEGFEEDIKEKNEK